MKNITQKVSEQNEYRVKQNHKTTILNIIFNRKQSTH